MSKLSVLTPKTLIAVLRKHGFQLDHTVGSHFVFYHPETKKRAVIPSHAKDLPRGTFLAILREAGLSKDSI